MVGKCREGAWVGQERATEAAGEDANAASHGDDSDLMSRTQRQHSALFRSRTDRGL